MTDVWARLEETIDELSRVTDIKSAAVVRRDGLVVTHTLPDGVDPKMVAAMTAAIVGTSEMATIQLAQGRFVRAIIESDGTRGEASRDDLAGRCRMTERSMEAWHAND